MKVSVDYKIIIVIGLLIIFGKIDLYFIFAVSIICHELVHILIAKIMGFKLIELHFGIFGMSANIAFLGKVKVLSRVLFYISGPLMNFFIAEVFKNINYEVTYINVALGIFNLLPIIPLDGGEILLELVKAFIGRDQASEIILCFTKIFLFIISILYAAILIEVKNIFLVFLLLFLWYLYYIEDEKWMLYKKVRKCIKDIEIN